MSLSYQDVRIVLAMIDGLTQGTAHLEQGDLVLTVEVAPLGDVRSQEVGSPHVHTVRSPGVGRIHMKGTKASGASKPGASIDGETVIATIVAPGREIPVTAGAVGRLVEFAVKEDDFVEYGQTLATVGPEKNEVG